ncbi:MAG: hypothetical protein RL417_1607, partial [Pseudomonadota bacterium]
MRKLEAILFDLGGVIIDLDWSRTTRAFRSLVSDQSGAAADRVLGEIFQNSALHEYERGEIPWESFRARISAAAGIVASEERFLEAWNAMILDIPQERIDLLRDLKNSYRVGLLSNTNERHVTFVNSYLARSYGIGDIGSLFHVPLYSHLVGMRKPEPRIYHHAAAALGVAPERILFIDDVKMNADAA